MGVLFDTCNLNNVQHIFKTVQGVCSITNTDEIPCEAAELVQCTASHDEAH